MSDDTIRDVLDIVTGWSRPLTDAEKLGQIGRLCEAALTAPLEELPEGPDRVEYRTPGWPSGLRLRRRTRA